MYTKSTNNPVSRRRMCDGGCHRGGRGDKGNPKNNKGPKKTKACVSATEEIKHSGFKTGKLEHADAL